MASRRWRDANSRFNRCCRLKKNVSHLILLSWTDDFNVTRDLRSLFRKPAYNLSDFVSLCRTRRYYVLYHTIFTNKERARLGPIADYTSECISRKFVEKICNMQRRAITIVGTVTQCKQLAFVKNVSFQTHQAFRKEHLLIRPF